MQCYVPVAVLSLPMCKVTDGFSQDGASLRFSTKPTKKNKSKNDLLTFPKWIICTGVPMTSPLDCFNPSYLRVWVLCRILTCCAFVKMCVYECVFACICQCAHMYGGSGPVLCPSCKMQIYE